MKRLLYFLLLIPFTINAQSPQNTDLTYTVKYYQSLTLHTNFTIPVVRYNINAPDNREQAYGKVTMFNSIGTGINLSYGALKVKSPKNNVSDKDDELDFTNLIGLNAGILFSVVNDTKESKNIFAGVIGLSILDVSIGWGYEFGDIPDGLEGHFFTVTYGLPIHKLFKKGSVVLYKDELKNDANFKWVYGN